MFKFSWKIKVQSAGKGQKVYGKVYDKLGARGMIAIYTIKKD